MPKITEFDTGNLALKPSEVGVEATAAAGRRLGGFYNQTAEAKSSTGQRVGGAVREAIDAGVQHIEHAEVHRGAASLMGLINQKSSEWNDLASKSDPNDPSIAQDFIENNLNPSLDQFQSGFLTSGGQKWAEGKIDAFRTHMFNKTSSDMSSRAADAVHMNVQKTLNSAVNTVYNDPSSLPFVMGEMAGSFKDMADTSPNLTPESRSKVTTELSDKAKREAIHAAISGTIVKGGDWESIANNPKYAPFINRAETETFAKAAQAQDRAVKRDEKSMMDWNHTEMVRDATLKLGKVFSDNVSYDETGKPIIKPGFFTDINKVVAGNELAADHARTLAEWGSRHLEDKAAKTSDPVVKQGLLDRFTSNNPPTDADILRAEANGKLSTQDGRVIRDLRKDIMQKPLTDPIYKATMDGVKGVLGTDPIGHEKYASFFQTFVPAYLTLPPDQQAKALDINDPNSLLSKTMAPLKRTPIQMILDKKAYGLIDPATAATALATGETIGGVKPTSIRTGGQVVLPPPDKRTIDQTYETPNGPRIWKGNGWAKPGAQ